MSTTRLSYEDLALISAQSSLKEKLSVCKQNAIAYLANQMSPKGHWQCFETLAGTSDEWVTAFVGCSLASLENSEARRMAEMAHEFLLQKDKPLRRKYKRARRLLLNHVDRSGGIYTYKLEGPIRYFTKLKRNVSFEGWCSSHTCVTAAVANLQDPQFGFTLDYLRRTQTSNGNWIAYWWVDQEYVTALAAAALHRNDPNDNSVQDALNWGFAKMHERDFVATSLFPDGSCYATAWILYLLSFSGQGHRLINIVEWLVREQRHDGSWNASAALRIPPPFCTDPESFVLW